MTVKKRKRPPLMSRSAEFKEIRAKAAAFVWSAKDQAAFEASLPVIKLTKKQLAAHLEEQKLGKKPKRKKA